MKIYSNKQQSNYHSKLTQEKIDTKYILNVNTNNSITGYCSTSFKGFANVSNEYKNNLLETYNYK